MAKQTETVRAGRTLEPLLDAATRLQEAANEAEAAQVLAEAVAATGWRTVVVSLYDGELETVAMGTAGVDRAFRERLVANRGDTSARRALFAPDREPFLVGRFYFIPEETIDELGLREIVIPTGDHPGQRQDAWRPADHAYAALRDSSGDVIGRVAIDDPASGLRPTPASLKTLSAFIDLASRTIENLRLRDALADAEQRAERAVTRWRNLVESVSVVSWEANPGSFDFTYVSPHAERVLGFTVREWLAPGFWAEHLHPEDRDRAMEFCLSQAKLGLDHDFEYRMIAKDGRTVWFRDSVSLVRDEKGEPAKICGILIDITAQKEADEARREQANRLRVLVEQLPAIMWTTDRSLVFTSSQGRGLESLSRHPGQVTGTSFWDYFGTDDPEFLPIAAHRRALRGENVNYEIEWLKQTYEVHVEPLYGPDGSIIGTIGVALDISSRKKAESRTLQAEERLRKITDAVPVQLAHIDANQHYLFNNETYERWYLKPRTQITGQHIRTLHGDAGYARVEQYVKRVLSGEQVQFESEFLGNISGISHVRTQLTPEFDEQGKVVGFFAVTMDISDRVQAERALSASLERQSKLLAELNHRVKNSMAGLLSLIDLSRRKENSVEDFAEAITQRVVGMTRVHSLLSSSEWRPIELRALLAQLRPPSAPGAFVAEGPPVVVPPGAATSLGMVLQELFSNSLTHGALGAAGGTVGVSWRIAPATDSRVLELELHWRESGGPEIDREPTPGLGTDLIRGFARHDLRGAIELRFPASGVDHTLRARFERGDP